jgi:DNA polymerase-3 subunit delta
MNERRVSRKDIDSLMIKSIESSIFKLVDFICEGNKDKALEILEDMIINNTPEQFIIHMIIRQYRMIYQYMLLKKKGYSQDEIMDRMKIKKFIAMKLSKLSGGLTLRKIDSYMDKFLEIDRKIKIGEIDNRIGLETITNGIIN